MDKLRTFYTNQGGFPAVNDSGATHSAQFLGAADTAESLTVPSGATVVRLVANSDCWYDVNGNTAAVPTADDAADAPIYLPGGLERWVQVSDVSSISLVSSFADTIISAAFFA